MKIHLLKDAGSVVMGPVEEEPQPLVEEDSQPLVLDCRLHGVYVWLYITGGGSADSNHKK